MIVHINSEDINKYINKVPQHYVRIADFCIKKDGDKPFFCELSDGVGGKIRKVVVNFYPTTLSSTATPSPSPEASLT